MNVDGLPLMSDGFTGMRDGSCPNRAESSPMNTKSRSLVLVNYFPDLPNVTKSCFDNSAPLIKMMSYCHDAAGKRWPNFIAVDYYQVFNKSLLISFSFLERYILMKEKDRTEKCIC